MSRTASPRCLVVSGDRSYFDEVACGWQDSRILSVVARHWSKMRSFRAFGGAKVLDFAYPRGFLSSESRRVS